MNEIIGARKNNRQNEVKLQRPVITAGLTQKPQFVCTESGWQMGIGVSDRNENKKEKGNLLQKRKKDGIRTRPNRLHHRKCKIYERGVTDQRRRSKEGQELKEEQERRKRVQGGAPSVV
jgi:hypothetical protein